jgi:hypothetical protein
MQEIIMDLKQIEELLELEKKARNNSNYEQSYRQRGLSPDELAEVQTLRTENAELENENQRLLHAICGSQRHVHELEKVVQMKDEHIEAHIKGDIGQDNSILYQALKLTPESMREKAEAEKKLVEAAEKSAGHERDCNTRIPGEPSECFCPDKPLIEALTHYKKLNDGK